MAAGMGSRYGGIKQLEPVGPSGEIIMDYSIYDAIEAGFNKIVFIIRKDIEEDFMNIIGKRVQQLIDVEFVFQDVTDLPHGFECPMDRTKPWGTGHAVLCCKDKVKEPFAVINADDYYGKEAFQIIHDYLVKQEDGSQKDYCMAGFILKNTLSDNGGVTRGICKVSEDNKLSEIYETKNIERKGDVATGDNRIGTNLSIDLESIVSMNMFGFTVDFLNELETRFIPFLEKNITTDLKAEYLIPEIIGDMVRSGDASVEVLKTCDSWFGVTYKEDKETVVAAFRNLIDQGVYPESLFEKK